MNLWWPLRLNRLTHLSIYLPIYHLSICSSCTIAKKQRFLKKSLQNKNKAKCSTTSCFLNGAEAFASTTFVGATLREPAGKRNHSAVAHAFVKSTHARRRVFSNVCSCGVYQTLVLFKGAQASSSRSGSCLMVPLSILTWFFTSPQGGLLTYGSCLTGLVSAFNGAPPLHHAVLLHQLYWRELFRWKV